MTDTFTFIWLAIGGGLRFFDFGRWTIPLAAWLSPVFLIHFARLNDPLTGIALIWLILVGAEANNPVFVGAIRFGKPAGIDAVHKALCRNAWFAQLPHEVQQAIVTIGEQRDVKRGDFVWRQGEAGDGLVIVLSGLLEDFVLAPNGRRSMTLIHGPGEWVGIVPTILDRPQRSSIVALESMKLMFTSRQS